MNNTIIDGNNSDADKVDRGIPSLKTAKKKSNFGKLAIVGGLLIAILSVAIGGALFMKQLEKNKKEQTAAKEKEHPQDAPAATRDFDATKERIKKDEAAALPPPASAPPASSTAPNSAGAIGVTATQGQGTSASGQQHQTQNSAPNAPVVETPAQRRLSGNVLVSFEGPNFASDKSDGRVGNASLGSNGSTSPPKDGFDEKLKPSNLADGRASQRPDLRYLMRRGTNIPCGQITKIITTHPGMVSCQIAKDVYSSNGEVLLIERGSQAFGEERTAMMQGQASIPVLWTSIDTPTGVKIDINSLGTDSLGASGHPAWVDNHIGERFGGAVMLSLIGDFGQALSNKSNSSSTDIKFSNTSNAGQDIATKTLDNTINIPPTAYSLQGSAINIFVARDMDFRTVYELSSF